MCTIPMRWILGRFFRPTVNVAWDEAQENRHKNELQYASIGKLGHCSS